MFSKYATLELLATYGSYIDFTIANHNFKGRILYSNSTNELKFHVNSNPTARKELNDTSLTVARDMKANNFVANGSSLN